MIALNELILCYLCLTLTKVVFELENAVAEVEETFSLTLTKVVFEF